MKDYYILCSNGITVPTKTRHTFGGYYTETNGGGTQYIDASGKLTSNASTTYFASNSGTLYAKWDFNPVKIVLSDDDEFNAIYTIIYEKYGEGFYLNSNFSEESLMTTSTNPIMIPEKSGGYKFMGYYSESGGEGVQIIDENGYLTSNVSATFFNPDNIDDFTEYNEYYVYNSIILYPYFVKPFTFFDWDTLIPMLQSSDSNKMFLLGETRPFGNIGTFRILNLPTFAPDPEKCRTDENISQTACGIVIGLELNQKYVMGDNYTSGGWPVLTTVGGVTNGIREFLNTNIYNSLPLDLKNAIIDTRVISGYDCKMGFSGRCFTKGNSGNNYISTDKIYLLSSTEIYGTNCGDDNLTFGDTYQLDYYQSELQIRNLDDSKAALNSQPYWLRSSNKNTPKYFMAVDSNGACTSYAGNTAQQVLAAFRIATE